MMSFEVERGQTEWVKRISLVGYFVTRKHPAKSCYGENNPQGVSSWSVFRRQGLRVYTGLEPLYFSVLELH